MSKAEGKELKNRKLLVCAVTNGFIVVVHDDHEFSMGVGGRTLTCAQHEICLTPGGVAKIVEQWAKDWAS